MASIFKHAIRRLSGQMLGWGIALGSMAFFLMILYGPLQDQQAGLETLLDALGDTMLAFLGGRTDFLAPAGYLDINFYSYLPVIAGIFAVLMGSGLLAVDEERGSLDLTMACPVSRTALFWGRFMALLVATTAILACTWLGFVAGLPFVDWNIGALDLLWPQMTLLALLMLFGAMALLLAMLLPSRAMAASTGGGILVLGYLVDSLSHINKRLEAVNAFLPFKYYQGGRAVDGLDWSAFLGLAAMAALFALLAWWRFLRRDIRVSGEGSWNLPLLRRHG